MDDILAKLNPAQREAVETTEGPVLIIAGAGSGKTRALTHRIAYLINVKKISPRNILAVTFTNKAAGEMKERTAELLSNGTPIGGSASKGENSYRRPNLNMPLMGTFHSICVRILRREIDKIGYKKSFNIFDDQDQKALMKKVMKEMEINIDQFKPQAILGAISKAKNELIDAQGFAAAIGGYYEEIVSKIYTAYQKRLKDQDALDFDDIIMLTVKIFKTFPEILENYQNLFRYIMADEYQDTNHAQYALINLLAKKFRNICVVGDDWQCFPAGTKILIPNNELKKIEKIARNEGVVSAAGYGESCLQKVLAKKKFKYNGDLIKITNYSGETLMATPNHILFSKLALNSEIVYVYLMFKKEIGYRIGVAKGARVSKSREINIGLNVRANQERADRMWILKVCKSKAEANYWEQYYGFFYGIPTLVFISAGRHMKFTQKSIDNVYQNINTTERVKKLFQDFNLNFDYPHHIPQSTIRNGVKRISINLTLFSDHRKSIAKPWGLHRISINSNDNNSRSLLEKNGFKTRKGKAKDWRLEITRLNYSEIESILAGISKILPQAVITRKAVLSDGKKFDFQPAGHIREEMVMPIMKKGKIIEEKVKKVEKIKYDGSVYDLNIANVHNYIANNFVVHNSIYSWRGADIQNILDFEKDYPEAKVVKLEQNYRSTQNILDAAYGVISKNKNRKDKKIWTENQGGQLITAYEADDERGEAEFMIREIQKMLRGEAVKLSDFVILYRTNAQSRIIEEAMLRNSMPYRIIGGVKFYQRKEIKDVIAYLRLTQNFNDEISLGRIINEPKRNIGETTLNKWISSAKENKIDLIAAGLQVSDSKISKQRVDNIAKFCDFIKRMQELSLKLTVTDLIEKVFKDSGYEKFLLDGTEEGEMRLENVKELLTVAQKYDEYIGEEGLRLFLEEVALISDTDNIDQQKEAVHMMTLHSAKGLEFKVVFIAGLEEGILPHSRSLLSNKEMEEERRLMYVGVTRAKEKVYLLFTGERNIFGSTQVNAPSRFIDDIPNHLLQDAKDAEFPISSAAADQFPSKSKIQNPIGLKFKDGDRVSHEVFGDGRIVASQGDVLTVAFSKSGLKKLSASVAPLRKIL
jgi:DNA helicase II / ATP-dependent DNA helicase PcrA